MLLPKPLEGKESEVPIMKPIHPAYLRKSTTPAKISDASRRWNEADCISCALTIRSLNIQEIEAAAGLSPVQAEELQDGALNSAFLMKFLSPSTRPLRVIA
jgi:hypothetical protein